MPDIFRIKCPICALEFHLAQWTINEIKRLKRNTIYCPLGHQLLISTLRDPKPAKTIAEVIAETEQKFKGEEPSNGQ